MSIPVVTLPTVLVPTDINDLAAAGFSDGQFAKRVGGAWAGDVPESNLKPLPQFTPFQIPFTVLSAGDNAINLNIPVGYILYCPATFASVVNPTSGTWSATLYLVSGSTNYLLSSSASFTQNSPRQLPLVMYSSDTLLINVGTAGAVMSGMGWLIPESSEFKPIRTFIGTGNNTIYSCPIGKKAMVRGLMLAMGSSTNQPVIYNNSGSTRIIKFHHVPNGGVADATNVCGYASVNNNSSIVLPQPIRLLQNQESFVVNSDGGTDMLGMFIIQEIS